MKKPKTSNPKPLLTTTTDISQTLISRYSKSTAPQHRHLMASASAMKSILIEESLPLTPPAFFAATISTLSDGLGTLDGDAVSALASLLVILVPMVMEVGLEKEKARDAVYVLVELLRKEEGRGEVAAGAMVRCVVKSVEGLVMLCDLEDWGGVVKGPFECVLGFALDKRPKVRRCAQECIEKLFKSFQHSVVIKESSKLMLSSFKNFMALATEFSKTKVTDESKSQMLLKPNDLEVLHMLNLLHVTVPYLSKKVRSNFLSELNVLMTCQFSPLTKHIHSILGVLFESSREKFLMSEIEDAIVSLVSYISSVEKNPMDTINSALVLLKLGLNKLHGGELSIWIRNLPLVFGAVAGFLVPQSDASSQAACIIKELINYHIKGTTFLASKEQSLDKFESTAKSSAMVSICLLFENLLTKGVPNEDFLGVISDLFLRLGDSSYFFMKDILLKLADLAAVADVENSKVKHLHSCIGSAVIAMGPEKILTLFPISLHEEKLTFSNSWLLPILKRYIVGSSLEYFMTAILPLVESLRQASKKGKHSERKELKMRIHDLLDLLPAFCRYPLDIHTNFGPFAKRLVAFLKKDGSMHENVALGLKVLVYQNRSILANNKSVTEFQVNPATSCSKEFGIDPSNKPSHYTSKVASRNIKAMKSCSIDLLQALTDVFFCSSPDKRSYLKEAIGCVASISESSEVTKIFISSMEKFQNFKGGNKSEKLSDAKESNGLNDEELVQIQKCIMFEFACALVDGAKEDLLLIIFDFIKPALMAVNEIDQSRAYYTLSRIFKEHVTFYSSRLDEMMDLLLGSTSPVDSTSLRSRFACFNCLLVYILQNHEEKEEKSFLILNEIVLTLKNSEEESRTIAYDMLLELSSQLKGSSSLSSSPSHQQLCTMIMGYLSGSPPTIMSGAIAALSLLIYTSNDICLSVPNLVPTVLLLLQSKAKEIIKAVLGFVKVLVSSLQASDLQKFLPDIVDKILPWSTVSRNHFRSKVIVILEIVIRKCGASVESLVPKKYERFIKGVMEQRHGKTNSNEAELVDTVMASTSSQKRGLKRMRGENSNSQEDRTASSFKTTDSREKKRRVDGPSRNEKHFKGNKSIYTGPLGNAKRKDFNSSRSPGRKAHKPQNKLSKTQSNKPATAFKLPKPRKAPRREKTATK